MHGGRGPSVADIGRLRRQMREESEPVRERKMRDAQRRLLRQVHSLGKLPPASAEYRRKRQAVARAAKDYEAARAAWVEAVVDQRAISHRIDVSRKLTEILTDVLKVRHDDPMAPVAKDPRRD